MKAPFFILLLTLVCGVTYAQTAVEGASLQPLPAERIDADSMVDTPGPYSAAVAMEGIVTSDKQVPFWLRANKYGSIPLEGVSASVIAGASRRHRTGKKVFDWGFSVQSRFNVSPDRSQLIFTEAYLEGWLSIFRLRAGRSADMMGLVDSTMSTGAFAVSGNSLGIPKAELSIPEFWSLPFTRGVFSVKGNFAMGYVGTWQASLDPATPYKDVKTVYHQKSFYGRLGGERWKVKLYAGFNHQVFWGDERKYMSGWRLSFMEATWKAMTGKTYRGSKVGNHLGSIDQGLEVEFKKFQVRGYHQFFYDVGGLYHLNNIKDGLWGLVITHKQAEVTRAFTWKKVLIEILNSKSQGGEPDAKITPSGDENYYNGTYSEGWSYAGENIGNPLFTSREYIKKGLPNRFFQYIVNNRVTALHIGFECAYKEWSGRLMLTGSSNMGTWASSPYGGSMNNARSPGPPPYFEEVRQFSGYLEASRPIGEGFRLGFALAVDQGQLLYNSVGGLIKLSRSF